MSVPFKVTASPNYHSGTTIGAYRTSIFPGGPPRPGLAPVGAPDATAVVSGQGTALFAGLAPATSYQAGDEHGTSWIAFLTPDEGEAGGGGVTTEEVEALIAEQGGGVPPKEEDLGEVHGTVKIDLSKPGMGLLRAKITADTTFELLNGPADPFGTSLTVLQDNVGGHNWTVNLEGVPIKWVGGTTEPAYPKTAKLEVLLTLLVVDGGHELLGITGLPGPKGDEGDEGPEGGKPTFHAIESFGAGVGNIGEPYAPCAYAVSGEFIHLAGVAKCAGAIAANAPFLTLPPGARPKSQKLLWVPNGETATTGVVCVLKTNGELCPSAETGPGFAPALDGLQIPLND